MNKRFLFSLSFFLLIGSGASAELTPDVLSAIAEKITVRRLEPCGSDEPALACAERMFDALKDYRYAVNDADKLLPLNFLIRYRNYQAMDGITTDADKEAFIRRYKEATGFPDLKEVSARIRRSYYEAVEETSKELNEREHTDKYTVLFAGFAPGGYLGNDVALPGDELELPYVIIKGDGNDDFAVAERFLSLLLSKTDYRLIPYMLYLGRKDFSERQRSLLYEGRVPRIYTKGLLLRQLTAVDEKSRELLKDGGYEEYRRLKYETVSDVKDM